MSIESLKTRIGNELYEAIQHEAEKQKAAALQMPLQDKWGKDLYFSQPNYFATRFDLYQRFQSCGELISPADVINVLFKVGLRFALADEHEYGQRIGGGSFVDPFDFRVPSSEIKLGYDHLLNLYLTRIENTVKEKTLIVEICNFNNHSNDLYGFVDKLSSVLGRRLDLYLPDRRISHKYKKAQPLLVKSLYTKKEAVRYFKAPSIGFTATGSNSYVYHYASAWMRAILNVLRISYFSNPFQLDFGQSGVEYWPPVGPVLLGEHTSGGYCLDEDRKYPWGRVPDGNLFQSFGYRSIAKMYLDSRYFSALEKGFLDSKIIFENLSNPYSERCVNDIWPTLELLSTSTQATDLGTKLLLIYTCLEHLFVPKTAQQENKAYIIGGIHALNPDLLDWFNQLYDIRCQYAHKGFILKTDKTLKLVIDSVKNTFRLLIATLDNRKR